MINFSIPEDKRELFIKTSIWNSVVEVFKSEKKIDVTDFLISIQVRSDSILVKTWRPLLNSECNIYDDKIKEKFLSKISKMWIKLENIEIRYI